MALILTLILDNKIQMYKNIPFYPTVNPNYSQNFYNKAKVPAYTENALNLLFSKVLPALRQRAAKVGQ
jgi:hypothetical protein